MTASDSRLARQCDQRLAMALPAEPAPITITSYFNLSPPVLGAAALKVDEGQFSARLDRRQTGVLDQCGSLLSSTKKLHESNGR